MYLTTGEIFFVDSPPNLVEAGPPREIYLHSGIVLHNNGYSKSTAGGRKDWYERTYKEWGTIPSHMRRIA